MSMGKREEKQQPLWIAAPELPRSAGHRFYDKLNELLREAGFDRRVEALCQRFYVRWGQAHAGSGRAAPVALTSGLEASGWS